MILRPLILLGVNLSFVLTSPVQKPVIDVSRVANCLSHDEGIPYFKADKLATEQTLTARADAVKEAFLFAWDGYMKYAFPHDELRPVTNQTGDSRNGWGASAVDALSTAVIMDLPDVVGVILNHIDKIDYTKAQDQVSLFETTIRYLAGMLSGYDLLDADVGLCPKCDRSLKHRLLEQSKKLADSMKYAFDTPTGVPRNRMLFPNKAFTDDDNTDLNGIAVTGTLVLEWMHLSDLTGDPSYGQLAEKAQSYLLYPHPKENEPFPGLLGSSVNVTSGEITDRHVSWGASHDSYYEYLIKMYVYDPARYGVYKDRWVSAVESSIKHLAFAPREDLTFFGMWSYENLDRRSSHLACFNGGSLVLGGHILNRKDILDFGLKLTQGCRTTYAATATGIGPETFGFDAESVPPYQEDFFKKHGFFIQDSSYVLRPEVIESMYYAWRITGDPKYRDWIWEAFVGIVATTSTSSGFSSISDVNAANGGFHKDEMESFIFGEVLKYVYMAHLPEGTNDAFQVAKDGQNRFVFNTEAHPVKVHRTDKQNRQKPRK